MTAAVEPENAAVSLRRLGRARMRGWRIGDGLIPDMLNTQIYDHIHRLRRYDEEALSQSR